MRSGGRERPTSNPVFATSWVRPVNIGNCERVPSDGFQRQRIAAALTSRFCSRELLCFPPSRLHGARSIGSIRRSEGFAATFCRPTESLQQGREKIPSLKTLQSQPTNVSGLWSPVFHLGKDLILCPRIPHRLIALAHSTGPRSYRSGHARRVLPGSPKRKHFVSFLP